MNAYMPGNSIGSRGSFAFPPPQRADEGDEVALLGSAFPEEDRGYYFRQIAQESLEGTIRKAYSIAREIQSERLSPIQIPLLTGHEKQVSPFHYRCVSKAIDRLRQRDCELILFFERYFPAHELSPPQFLSEERGVPQKAEAIREEIQTHPYSLTTLKREGELFFRRAPLELVDFTMSEEIRLELFLYDCDDSLMDSFLLWEPWYFNLLAVLLEAGKFDFLFEEEPPVLQALSAEERTKSLKWIQKRLESVLDRAVGQDRTATVRILLERIGGKIKAYWLKYLLKKVANRENGELVELLQQQYRKNASCYDYCEPYLDLFIYLTCCCCFAYIYCCDREERWSKRDYGSWQRFHVYREVSSAQLHPPEKLVELDQRIIRFFEYYTKQHQMILPAMREGSEEAKAEMLRKEVRERNYVLTGDDLRAYHHRRNPPLPPEIAFFRMTLEAFNLLIQDPCFKKEGEEETLFGLIESGKLEFFYPSLFGYYSCTERDASMPSLLKKYLLRAVKFSRIPTIEILLRVLGRKLTHADLRECRNATEHQGILDMLKKASCAF